MRRRQSGCDRIVRKFEMEDKGEDEEVSVRMVGVRVDVTTLSVGF